MSLAIVYSRASAGMLAPMVMVEVHLSNGLPGLSIVGLPETAVKESKDRVRSAIINSDFEFPLRRVTVNLAPADLPKEGGRFDLAIALGILAASEQIPRAALQAYEFAGELALSGELRRLRGVLPFALETAKAGRKLIIPAANIKEAGLVDQLEIYPARSLLQVCSHLHGQQKINVYQRLGETNDFSSYPDLLEVKGQWHAKRALEIAAAGGHSLLLIGPPGTGKTMLASRLPGILPLMSESEALEAAAIASLSHHCFDYQQWRCRPFRAPHHTASSAALVGGGRPPRPGEISLAHQGVLFLDELPEFNRHVLEALREPLEAGSVTISRAARQAQFPAKFQLVAAMNPCPCGYVGDASSRCRCTSEQVRRYQTRLSGPLLDRLDMHVLMPALPARMLFHNDTTSQESSASVRQRVARARERQLCRAGKVNALLSNQEMNQYCQLAATDFDYLEKVLLKLGLSARAYYRVLKLARTIADLRGEAVLNRQHLQEALGFRNALAANQKRSN